VLVHHNRLTTLPSWFAKFDFSGGLDVSYNELASLPDFLDSISQLKRIQLHHNKLAIIPRWISRLDFEEALDLSTNQLTTLPTWLPELNFGGSLSISSNPLNLEAAGVVATTIKKNKNLKSLEYCPSSHRLLFASHPPFSPSPFISISNIVLGQEGALLIVQALVWNFSQGSISLKALKLVAPLLFFSVFSDLT